MTARAARPPLMTANEAATYLGQPPDTLKRWRHEGTGPPYIKLGHRTVMYDPRDLDRFVDGLKVVPGAPSVANLPRQKRRTA